MLKAGVTVGCAAAMVTAAVLVVRLRHTRRTPSPLSGSESFSERLAVAVSRSGGMLTGAYLAGLLTVGAGGRLMMRVLAATSSDAAQGQLTEADEVVGKVSVGGSMFLIAVLGLGAALAGLALFSMLRRWLPDQSVLAGLIGVAIGAGVLVRPSGLLSSSNTDFTLLAPLALAVAFCLTMLALFGATFGVLVDHLAPRWPRPGWSPRGVASLLPFAVLAPSPPLFVGVAISVLGGTVALGLRSRPGADLSAVPAADRPGARRGRTLVTVLGGAGCLSVIVAAGQVLVL